MSTEVWFRNPERYMPLLVDAGATRVLWHRGRLQRRRVDPLAHARMSWPSGAEWRVLVVDVRGALEYTPASKRFEKPAACYPVWHYGEPIEVLEGLLESNVAESPAPFDDDPIFTPVPGQEHRVLVSGWPELNSNFGRRFMGELGDIQRDFPQTIVHLFEPTSYRTAFGFGLRSVDLDPAIDARWKKVHLANGKFLKLDQAQSSVLQWIALHGLTLDQLYESTENRVLFNARSAMWAGENYDKKIRFRTAAIPLEQQNVDSPDFQQPTTRSYKSNPLLVSVEGDKVACDKCSLVNACKYARAGSVCTLPESETAGLARFFKTRDADSIIDGLGAILQVQAERAAMGMENEGNLGEIDPDTTAILKAMFEGGVKLAKLINPALSPSGPKIAVQINQGNGANQVHAANPKALMAALVRELEDRGVPRSDITPEMVMNLVQPREIVEVNEAP